MVRIDMDLLQMWLLLLYCFDIKRLSEAAELISGFPRLKPGVSTQYQFSELKVCFLSRDIKLT